MAPLGEDLRAHGAPRESNASDFQLRPSSDRAPGGISSVPVKIAVLTELRTSQHELEAYLRASFASHDRFGDSVTTLNSLADGKTRPSMLKSTQFWRRIDESLGRISPIADELMALGLEDAQLAGHAKRFDEALHEAVTVVRGMGNPAQQGDPKVAVANLQKAAFAMRDAARDMVSRCEREAERVIDGMKSGLEKIFSRIEIEQEREMERQTTRLPEVGGYRPSGHDQVGQAEHIPGPAHWQGAPHGRDPNESQSQVGSWATGFEGR